MDLSLSLKYCLLLTISKLICPNFVKTSFSGVSASLSIDPPVLNISGMAENRPVKALTFPGYLVSLFIPYSSS